MREDFFFNFQKMKNEITLNGMRRAIKLGALIGRALTNKHFFPLTGGCSEGLGAFRFFFKNILTGGEAIELIA